MYRRSFTMLELAIVMVIAVALMTIGLTAFRDWNKGTEVEEASRLIGSLLLQTKQTALRQRRYTALVMPGPNADGLADEDRYKFARLAYVNKVGSAYEFDSWVGFTEWVKMPPGVTIMEVDGDIGLADGSTFQRLPKHNSPPTVDNVNLQVRFGGGSSVDNVRAIVYSPSGRVKISSNQYITVADARYVANQWIIHKASRLVPESSGSSQEIGPANQITVKINRYTGHTSFHMPSDYKDGYIVE